MRSLSQEGRQKLNDQLNEEFKCLHEQAATSVLVAKDGRPYYRVQCQRCGYQVKALKRSELTPQEIQRAIPFDSTLITTFWQKRTARYEELEKELLRGEQMEFDVKYAAYLASAKWQELRLRVLKRDKYACQGCGVNRAVDVHHLTYDRLYEEMLFDLISVCRQCHTRLHPQHQHAVEWEEDDEDPADFDDD